MARREPITYADKVPDLPQSDFAKRLQDLRVVRLFAERAAANQNDRQPQNHSTSHIGERSMVEKDQPYPRPRPSPDFAAEVDAASFDARWEAERQHHIPSNSTQPQKGERPMSDDIDNTNRPEETLREGPLKAAIWRNKGEHGAYHTVTVARTYKDKDGQLQDTQSFRPKDMLGSLSLRDRRTTRRMTWTAPPSKNAVKTSRSRLRRVIKTVRGKKAENQRFKRARL